MNAAAPAPEITVAVPVRNRREQMRRCLHALLAQDHANFEILVLDNCSDDGTAEICRDLARDASISVRIEVLPGSVGALRNHAAKIARGEFLAFTDSDCLPERGWLTAASRALNGDPDVGVICGVTLPEEVPRTGWPATIEVRSWSGRFESCNVVFRTQALRQSDGFDEEVGHYWEDTAAGYAVLADGWKARFVRDAVVRHDVTYPGFKWHIQRALKQSHMGPVLSRYPEVASDLLWAGLFVSPRDAKFLAASLAVACRRRRALALALCLPYMQERLLHPWWRDPKGLVQTIVFDAANVAGAVAASARAGRLVL